MVSVVCHRRAQTQYHYMLRPGLVLARNLHAHGDMKLLWPARLDRAQYMSKPCHLSRFDHAFVANRGDISVDDAVRQVRRIYSMHVPLTAHVHDQEKNAEVACAT